MNILFIGDQEPWPTDGMKAFVVAENSNKVRAGIYSGETDDEFIRHAETMLPDATKISIRTYCRRAVQRLTEPVDQVLKDGEGFPWRTSEARDEWVGNHFKPSLEDIV